MDEISGGSETYARKIAEHLANRYEVEVLTTKAVDSATWKDWYVRDVETIHGVTVRRFSVQQMRVRDFQAFDEAYLAELAQGRQNLVTEKEWFEKHGPYAPDCIRYLRHYRDTYAAILFLSDANYLTYAGMPLAGNRAVFIPMAQNTSFLQFSSLESLYQRPRAFVFLSEEERLLVRRRFPRTEPIPCAVMGLGMDVPRQTDPGTFRRQYGLEDEYLLLCGTGGRKERMSHADALFHGVPAADKQPAETGACRKKDLPHPGASGHPGAGLFAGEQKFSAIAGAKAVVIPSRQMGVSMTLLESMAMSVPVLVNGGSPVLLGHCKKKSNGGLFYQNYFEFEGAVRYLMQHPVEYMQLCSNARAYITANYDWESIMQRFSQIIEWVSAEKN